MNISAYIKIIGVYPACLECEIANFFESEEEAIYWINREIGILSSDEYVLDAGVYIFEDRWQKKNKQWSLSKKYLAGYYETIYGDKYSFRVFDSKQEAEKFEKELIQEKLEYNLQEINIYK